jgi:hypothetical protein
MFVVTLLFCIIDMKISLSIVNSLCKMAKNNTIKLEKVLWAKNEVIVI